MDKKICVYAISKNEIKFVERWFNSVKEADYICVLDTGSTDGTFEKFKELGVITEQKIYKQFRFDTARNDSLKLVPEDADILVCIDIDEVFESGWAEKIKNNWKESTSRMRYRYTWNFNEDGSEGIVFMADKIHKNKEFTWKHPVHEILVPIKNQNYETIDVPTIQVNHLADVTKSRSSYLPLLELSVKEDPTDDRNMHYLGREYMFHGDYNKAITTLLHHLSLPSAKWDAERSASLRYIANCYSKKEDKENQEKYLLLSILECSNMRESYFQLATFYYEQKDYLKSAFIFEEMLKIKNKELNYISSPVCWGSIPYDYLSLCYFELKKYDKSFYYISQALNFEPNNERLKNNKKIIQNYLKI